MARKIFLCTSMAVALGVAGLAAPFAISSADAQARSTSGSASAQKPVVRSGKAGSTYRSQATRRAPARTAASVINARHAQQQAQLRRRAGRWPAINANARLSQGSPARAITNRTPPADTRRFAVRFDSSPISQPRRGSVASVQLDRLVRGPDGRAIERAAPVNRRDSIASERLERLVRDQNGSLRQRPSQ